MGFENYCNSTNCNILSKMSEELEIKVQNSPRKELIDTAVNFLINPNVQKSPAIQKEAFLKKKGLTTEEIKIAFEKSINHMPLPVIYGQQPPAKVLWFQKIKNTLSTVALLLGASYGLFYLYRKFLEPFLSRNWRKPKSSKDSLDNLSKPLEKAFSEIKNDMQRVQNELERVIVMQNDHHHYSRTINELKSDITTIKGILLSRHQFSSVNLTGPSIPAWQLAEAVHKDDKESLETEDGEHNSGSSETEIVANPNSNGGSQGSDSSLEMIKEVDN